MLGDIKGVGEKIEKSLNAIGIESEDDLAFFAPAEYLDLSSSTVLFEAGIGDFILLELQLTEVKPFVKKGKLNFTIAYGVTEDGFKVKLVFYNLPYVSRVLKRGESITVYGKLSYDDGYRLVNPTFEKTDSIKNLCGIRPLYRTRGKLPQSTLSKIIKNLLSTYNPKSLISVAIETKYNLLPLHEALIAAHCPSSVEEGKTARKRLYIEQAVRTIRRYNEERLSVPRIKSNTYVDYRAELDKVIAELPFSLTPSQRNAINSIVDKLIGDSPLNALLEGDVGSGKTIVALLAAYFAKLNGYQSAILSPTTILATQHYETATELLSCLGLKAALLTSSISASEKKAVLDSIKNGSVDVVIGTQSLLSQKIVWNNLSLLVIDEQHKFGIKDREKLAERFSDIDTLSLTATPIPRSLSLVYFGCTDAYFIEGHSERKVKTYVVGRDKEAGLLDYVSKKALDGEKIFIVAPAIEDMEGVLLSGVKDVYSEVSALDGVRAGCLHGKLSDTEKESVIKSFKDGTLNVLVSTSIVEVGIDVPEAGVLVVMHADRFGLAALHQLRGRIGRQGQRSECFLYTEKDGETKERLRIFSTLTRGAEIAALDYDNRGAGEIFGLRQSGSDKTLPPLTVEELKLAAEIEGVVVR